MENITNISKLSRVDELSVRKLYVEKMLEEVKKQTEDKVLLMLASAFEDNVKSKTTGQIVFMEKWLEDINNEIKNL